MIPSELDLTKLLLYRRLLTMSVDKYTDLDAELLNILSKDSYIQSVLDKTL